MNFTDQPSFCSFLEAVKESVLPLVLFVGSGPSTEAGLPDWKQLRKNVQIALSNQERAYDQLQEGLQRHLHKQAKQTEDYWQFFEFAKRILHEYDYRDAIKKSLDAKDLPVPKSYHALSSLNPNGIVTINLDSFVGQAYAEALNPTNKLLTIYGNELNKKHRLLSGELNWLLYLHGHISDPDSWVLTTTEIENAKRNVARDFALRKLYTENIVLFVGMSVNDISISESLSQLKQAGIDTPHLYWLTANMDYISTDWANKHQIRPIYYKATNSEHHSKNIDLFVNEVKKSRIKDSDKFLEGISFYKDEQLEIHTSDASEIALMQPNVARKTLSVLLARHLEGLDGDELYMKFDEFLERYDFPIRTRAFYVHPNTYPDFFNYKIIVPIGEGNFGKVFLARDEYNNNFAIKIIREEIQTSTEMLGGFRRGIRSMQILKNHGIENVAKLEEAFEMPPTIVMSHVSGQSLEELHEHSRRIPWQNKIVLIHEVAKIVHQCHRLPETVLHRDLKPSNIMVTNFDWAEGSFEQVIVLDFDMSWHKGSKEKDIIFESRDDFGYLAPEQTNPNSEYLARSAKVDSFGLGMTLYSILSGEHPRPDVSMDPERWKKAVSRGVTNLFNQDVKCLKNRVARLIIAATQVDQQKRLTFLFFLKRIDAVVNVINGISDEKNVDIYLEEILSEISRGAEYTWDDLNENGSVSFVSGVNMQIKAGPNDIISFEVNYNDPGNVIFKRRDSVLGGCAKVLQDLKKNAHEDFAINHELRSQQAKFELRVVRSKLYENIEIIQAAFDDIVNSLNSIGR